MNLCSETLAGAVPVAIAVLDSTDLTVRWHNDLALRMLPEPHRSDGIAGLRLTDILPVAEAVGVVEKLLEVSRTGRPFHMTTHLVGVSERGVSVSASAYRLHSGELLLVTDRR